MLVVDSLPQRMPLAAAVVRTPVVVAVAIAAPGDSIAPIALQDSGRRNSTVAVLVSKCQMQVEKGIHECW
jgi:hypothetical protein